MINPFVMETLLCPGEQRSCIKGLQIVSHKVHYIKNIAPQFCDEQFIPEDIPPV